MKSDTFKREIVQNLLPCTFIFILINSFFQPIKLLKVVLSLPGYKVRAVCTILNTFFTDRCHLKAVIVQTFRQQYPTSLSDFLKKTGDDEAEKKSILEEINGALAPLLFYNFLFYFPLHLYHISAPMDRNASHRKRRQIGLILFLFRFI